MALHTVNNVRLTYEEVQEVQGHEGSWVYFVVLHGRVFEPSRISLISDTRTQRLRGVVTGIEQLTGEKDAFSPSFQGQSPEPATWCCSGDQTQRLTHSALVLTVLQSTVYVVQAIRDVGCSWSSSSHARTTPQCTDVSSIDIDKSLHG